MSAPGVAERDWAALVGAPGDAVDREREHRHPHAEVRRLADAGFGALRVPTHLGGAGVDVATLARALVDVASVDPNVAQALRAHVGLVEQLLAAPEGPERGRWLRRIAAGPVVGNATTERGRHPQDVATSLRPAAGGGWRLDGTKHYCTGTLVSDLVAVLARTEDGALVTAIVPTDRDGVTVHDDWDGFGQQTSASGTVTLDGVRVEPQEVLAEAAPRPSLLGPFYQLVLLAVQAGIARNAARDAGALVRSRGRNYDQATAQRPADDPLVQVAVGEIAAAAFAAEALVDAGAEAIDHAIATGEEVDAVAAWVTVGAAQVGSDDLVVAATDRLFDAGSASALAATRGLDRHWRNARTISSHNSVPQRARALGDQLLNGTRPTFGSW